MLVYRMVQAMAHLVRWFLPYNHGNFPVHKVLLEGKQKSLESLGPQPWKWWCWVCVCVYRLNRRKTSSLYYIIYGRGMECASDVSIQRRRICCTVIWIGDAQSTYLLNHLLEWEEAQPKNLHVVHFWWRIWTWKPFRRTSIIRRMLR